MAFLFKNRDDAEGAISLLKTYRKPPTPNHGIRRGREITSGVVQRQDIATTGWLMKTIEEIPARDGNTPGRADCKAYYLKYTDELDPQGNPTGTKIPEIEVLEDNAGVAIEIEILNVFSSPIAADTFITVKEVFGRLVADAEDCSADGGAAAPAGGSSPPATYGGETI